MKNIIKVLPADQAQMIAAGEVVERPANIVKELVENSLDAGASFITVILKRGGKSFIRVVDNGSGMTEDDAFLSFHPYATSKIEKIDQLAHVNSYGFRGEALASIAAVAKVTLITKSQELSPDQLGTLVSYAYGIFDYKKPVSCLAGTTITVEGLFEKIPVRKKFLKADDVEYHAIYTLMQAFMLSKKQVHFKLIHNEEIVINTPPAATLFERAQQVFSAQFLPGMHELITPPAPDNSWYRLFGIIVDPQFWCYNRNNMFFFVNDRWVKSQELSKALIKGYLNVLPAGRFPAAALFVSVLPGYVDINVHPKKEEVRFLKPATLQSAVSLSVTTTLKEKFTAKIQGTQTQANQEQSPGFVGSTTSVFKSNFEPHLEFYRAGHLDSLMPLAEKFAASPPEKISFSPEFAVEKSLPIATPSVLVKKEGSSAKEKEQACAIKNNNIQEKYTFKVIGQLFNTYIIIEQGKECLLIDQHAAHERILYEKMEQQFEQKDGIQLLFPENIALEHHDCLLLKEHDFFLRKQGVICDYNNDNTGLVIKAAPPLIQHVSLGQFLQEIIAYIKDHGALDHEYFKKQLDEFIRGEIACKGAIKAGDRLSLIQMEQLVNDLMVTERRFICVHGRPTIFTLAQAFIARQFQRT